MNPELAEVDDGVKSLLKRHPAGNVRLHLERKFAAPWSTSANAVISVHMALCYLRENPRDTEIRDLATRAWKRWTGGNLEKVLANRKSG